jgi:hypothetical protein
VVKRFVCRYQESTYETTIHCTDAKENEIMGLRVHSPANSASLIGYLSGILHSIEGESVVCSSFPTEMHGSIPLMFSLCNKRSEVGLNNVWYLRIQQRLRLDTRSIAGCLYKRKLA